MHDAIRTLLAAIGEDPDREGLKDTPERFGRAFRELTRGYGRHLADIVGGVVFNAESHDLILVRDIAFVSLCEHHLLPFMGRAHIGYLPDRHCIGLSKIPRIVDLYARRLQTQERLGREIADALEKTLQPKGVGVVIEAEHCCMSIRGVEKRECAVRTHHFRGLNAADFPL